MAAAVHALAGRGAGGVVLGCTEIPLGLPPVAQAGLGVDVVDSIDALALAAIGWAAAR